jgi:hypothetical protein
LFFIKVYCVQFTLFKILIDVEKLLSFRSYCPENFIFLNILVFLWLIAISNPAKRFIIYKLTDFLTQVFYPLFIQIFFSYRNVTVVQSLNTVLSSDFKFFDLLLHDVLNLRALIFNLIGADLNHFHYSIINC